MNISEVRNYFKYLSHVQNTVFTGAWFYYPAGGELGEQRIVPGYATVFGQTDDVLKQYEELRGKYNLPCFHVCLNETSLKGRRREHIDSVRCLAVDIDREIELEEYKELLSTFSPQLVVESSPGKHHFYWRLSNIVNLKTWELFQLGLARMLGGDKTKGEPTSLLRIPGFERLCKGGNEFLPRIKHFGAAGVLSLTDVSRLFKGILGEGEKAKAELAEERRALSRTIQALKKGQELKSGAELTAGLKAGRNTALYYAIRKEAYSSLEQGNFNERHLEILGLKLNDSYSEPLSLIEAERTIKSAISKAQKSYERRQSKLAILDEDKDEAEQAEADVSAGLEADVSAGLEADVSAGLEADVIAVVNNPELFGEQANSSAILVSNDAERLNTRENSEQENQEGSENNENKEVIENRDKDIVEEVGGHVDGPVPLKSNGHSVPHIFYQNGEGTVEVNIPDCLARASDKFAEKLYAEEGEYTANLMEASFAAKHYVRLADFLCEKFAVWIGCFRISGPHVFVSDFNRWGQRVFFGREVSKEQFSAMIIHTVAYFARKARDNEKLKGCFKEFPKNHVLNAVGESSSQSPRQSFSPVWHVLYLDSWEPRYSGI